MLLCMSPSIIRVSSSRVLLENYNILCLKWSTSFAFLSFVVDCGFSLKRHVLYFLHFVTYPISRRLLILNAWHAEYLPLIVFDSIIHGNQ